MARCKWGAVRIRAKCTHFAKAALLLWVPCSFCVEKLVSVLAKSSVGRDVSVEGLSGNPELLTEIPDVGSGCTHRRHGQAQLGSGHLELALPPCAPRASGGEPGFVRSEISSRSNSASAAKMPKTSLPEGVVVSMAAPCPVSTLEPDAALGQVIHGIHQIVKVAAEAIQLPDHQRIPLAQRLYERLQAQDESSALPGRPDPHICDTVSTPAARSASRCKSRVCDPSAFDTRM